MGKKSPDAPPPPDYAAAARATSDGNLAAAKYATEANRVNTYTPYGNLTYQKNADGTWRSDVNLAPAQQSLLDQQNKTSEQLGGLQNSAADRVGSTFGQNVPGAYDPQQATNNASDLINQRLLPQQQRDQNSLNTQLANQGITAGSEAYKNAEDQLGRNQNDARQQSQLAGITLGQSQQGQQYSQATENRNIPINELNALRTGAQVTNPTFQQAPQQQTTAGPDLLGAAGQQNKYGMGLYNSQVGQNNAQLGMLGQVAGTAAMYF